MYSVHRRLRQRKAHQLATMVLLLRDTTVKAAAQRGARHMVWLLKRKVHTVAAIGALQSSRTIGEAATDADAARRPELQGVRVALQLRRSDKVASGGAVGAEGDLTIGGRRPHNRLSELSDPHATRDSLHRAEAARAEAEQEYMDEQPGQNSFGSDNSESDGDGESEIIANLAMRKAPSSSPEYDDSDSSDDDE